MLRRLCPLAVALLLLAPLAQVAGVSRALAGPLAPSPPATAPATVPALQAWHSGGRPFVLPRGALAVEPAAGSAGRLTRDARTFAGDLQARTGRPVVVQRAGRDRGHHPAIELRLDPSVSGHGTEQYRITVDGDVEIAAAAPAGIWNGTRTVLQWLAQGSRIAGGVADDWPAYPERSFLVDNGRKYFTPAWTRRQIRELSYLKYNQFHWHITDNAGFRIESTTHPEVVSPDHWSQQQVRDLVAYAARYHVEVIPEIDMPGHLQYALRTHPELQIVDAAGNRNAANLDPTKPAARAFVRDLLDELLPLFPGRYIHTGGDEFTADWSAYPALTAWAQAKYGAQANAHDAVLDFTNYVDGIVRAHGKTMRIWNDGGQGGAVVRANRDIVLEYWSSQHGGELAQQFLDDGYRLVNADRNVLYDVPGATESWQNTDPRVIFDQWDMTRWHDWIGPNTTAPDAPGVLGGQLSLWNDHPTAATEEQEAQRVEMPLRAMIQQLWGSPVTDPTWDAYASSALAVGHEPRWALLAGPSQDVALGGLAWSSARERPDCPESALVDGDDTTRWCGPKTAPQSVIVDLGRRVTLGTVVLHWETAFASGYSLELSDDLRTWTPAYSTATGAGGVEVLPIRGTGRYLRVAMTTRGTQYGYSLYEIRAYARNALVPSQFAVTAEPSVVLAAPGTSGTANLTVTNSSTRATDTRWVADVPAGVRLHPHSGRLVVPAGGTVSVPVRITAGAQPGNATVPITVSAESLGERVTLARTDLAVSVPFDRLADAFGNVGVTSDDDIAPPTLGDGFDGAGSAYSAEALAAAGITPGATVAVGGVTVQWPDAPVAQADNAVADGQSLALHGTGSRIAVVAASTYGPVAATWVVHYADGTSDSVHLSTPDWSSTPPAGTTVLADMPYHNNPATGRVVRRSLVFVQTIPVDPGKEIVAVTLPQVSPTAVRGAPALHVFDVRLG